MNRWSTAPEPGEEPVMGQPEEPDHHEAQEEAEDLGVLVARARRSSFDARDVRDADAHDEQRHGDGEHRVAEERHPVELELLRPPRGSAAPACRRAGRRRRRSSAISRAGSSPTASRTRASTRCGDALGAVGARRRGCGRPRPGSRSSSAYRSCSGRTNSTTASATARLERAVAARPRTRPRPRRSVAVGDRGEDLRAGSTRRAWRRGS